MANASEQEAYHRELYRRSLDSIRVFNPTDEDFIVVWDKFKHIVPSKNKDMSYGKGQKVLPRYIAEKYARSIKDKMIHEMADKKLEQLKESYEKQGSEDPLLKANLTIERRREYRTDNRELIKEIYAQIWLGVEEEYGLLAEEKKTANDGKIDTRPVEEQILSGMDKKYVPEEVKKEVLIDDKPVNKPSKSKADVVKGVAK
jgi:hypothetical protein